MKITKVQKGEKLTLPVTREGQWVGWTTKESPEDGLLFVIEPQDGSGFIVSNEKLRDLGYSSFKRIEDLLDMMT